MKTGIFSNSTQKMLATDRELDLTGAGNEPNLAGAGNWPF